MIAPNPFQQGAVITSIDPASDAYLMGLTSDAFVRPMDKEVILYLGDTLITDAESFHQVSSQIQPDETVRIETTKNVYHVKAGPDGHIGLDVKDAPTNNIRKGLDLEGGIQVFLQPEHEVDELILEEAVQSLKLRLNTYGLSDISVRKITNPDQYIVVEIAGSTQEEVKKLIGSQGKFEAKIGETLVLGATDIRFVSRDAQNSRVDECLPTGTSYLCSFVFNIIISPEAAQVFATETGKLDVVGTSLSKTIDFYLDDIMTTNLTISADLKGRAITQPSITGSELGPTEKDAYTNAQKEMNRLQTIIETGSLPVKLNIVRTSVISPKLGQEFVKNAILVGLLSILAVACVCYAFFRNLKIVIPMVLTMIIEVVFTLGLASFVNWQLDLAAIAGIVIATGTGVDDQIVIAREVIAGQKKGHAWTRQMERAFFIILAAYLVNSVALLPLWWAGAGLLKGFAFINLAGITIGVFLTRPAYAKLVEYLHNKN